MAQFDSIFSLFKRAATTLKYPSIRLTLRDGTKANLYLATKGYIAIKLDGEYVGKITPDTRSFRMYQGTAEHQQEVLEFALDPVTEGKIHGQKFGHCCFCKQELTNAISIYNGYGPICAENYGLPWEPEQKEPIDSIKGIL